LSRFASNSIAPAGPTAPMISEQGSLRNVLIEGQIELVKVAAALSMRCCVHLPEVETVKEHGLEERR
jgi:hypothetical protein